MKESRFSENESKRQKEKTRKRERTIFTHVKIASNTSTKGKKKRKTERKRIAIQKSEKCFVLLEKYTTCANEMLWAFYAKPTQSVYKVKSAAKMEWNKNKSVKINKRPPAHV